MKKRLAIKGEDNINEVVERLQMLGGWPGTNVITTAKGNHYYYLDH